MTRRRRTNAPVSGSGDRRRTSSGDRWRTSSGDRRRSSLAFTLIEIIVVLFFMVLASAIALPRFADFMRSSRARDIARDVAGTIRQARETAIESQRPVTLELDPESRVLRIVFDDTMLPGALDSAGTDSAFGSGAGGTAVPPLSYPETIELEMAAASSGAGSSDKPVFTPEGRASDIDLLVAYGPNRALRVAARRQATQVRITGASGADGGVTDLLSR